MKKPELPADEASRLAVLGELNIVFSPAEERFDRITRLARRIFSVPFANVSLVTATIQWFKSSQGLKITEIPREVSFCAHAILGDEPLVINDTQRDPDYADNPLVTDEPYIRFYAGQAIQYAGKKLGTLCVMDTRPRVFLASDRDSLCSLAAWVESELRLSAVGEEMKGLLAEYDEIQRKVLIDPLTSCWNRQGMEEILNLTFARTKRTKDIVTMMMIAVDNFQDSGADQIKEGKDFILKEIAQRIRITVRTHDIIARDDGDQFLVLLTDCNKGTAKSIAQRILRDVAIEPIQTGTATQPCTISIGMVCNEGMEQWDWRRLVNMAARALEEARKAGGNRSMIRSRE